jgi:regulator of protease activity HflC (stomatin/prohibitin superfamily)
LVDVIGLIIWPLTILALLTLVIVLMTGVRIIQPYEQGLLIVLGNYKRLLNPGFNYVPPLISRVIKIDLRTQPRDVPRQEVITKDNSPTNVDAIIYIKVIDPVKAEFEVSDYKAATIYLAQTTLRSLIGDMELDEILYNRDRINTHLRDILDEATDKWGVKVDAVEIREVDPVGPVKAAMEEQTAAERERRAAILRADGNKRSAILKAEGSKRSRILQAEGLRQAAIVEAEGERLARILKAQGDAQKLRILSLGAAPMDQKALTVLSLETLKTVGDGKSTKIIFPFEISKLLEGAAEYIGGGRTVPERPAPSLADLENDIGKTEDILGIIPNPSEIRSEINRIDQEMAMETKATEAIAKIAEKKAPLAKRHKKSV